MLVNQNIRKRKKILKNAFYILHRGKFKKKNCFNIFNLVGDRYGYIYTYAHTYIQSRWKFGFFLDPGSVKIYWTANCRVPFDLSGKMLQFKTIQHTIILKHIFFSSQNLIISEIILISTKSFHRVLIFLFFLF